MGLNEGDENKDTGDQDQDQKVHVTFYGSRRDRTPAFFSFFPSTPFHSTLQDSQDTRRY
jgi:hypothetical protein